LLLLVYVEAGESTVCTCPMVYRCGLFYTWHRYALYTECPSSINFWFWFFFWF